jgi:hypothetical protein
MPQDNIDNSDIEATLYLDSLGPFKGTLIAAGSFADMCQRAWIMGPVPRRFARIETRDQTYSSNDLERMRRENPHAPALSRTIDVILGH